MRAIEFGEDSAFFSVGAAIFELTGGKDRNIAE